MKVVDTNNTTHNITLIPRFDTSNSLTLNFYNEASKVSETVANTHSLVDGYLTLTYDYTYTEGDKFQIEVLDGSEVVYRGKLISTTQEPQEYKLTNDLYIYG